MIKQHQFLEEDTVRVLVTGSGCAVCDDEGCASCNSQLRPPRTAVGTVAPPSKAQR
jgi:hypothetical protein